MRVPGEKRVPEQTGDKGLQHSGIEVHEEQLEIKVTLAGEKFMDKLRFWKSTLN